MKKSRIIAILTAFAMIMSAIPAFAVTIEPGSSFVVSDDGTVYQKGENLISNPSFENGAANGLVTVGDVYTVSDRFAHTGAKSLAAVKSTTKDSAISLSIPVSDATNGYYLSFWYLNTDRVARRPRITFTFTGAGVPDANSDFADETNAWIDAGTASNPADMEYSTGEWVQYSTIIKGNGKAADCKQVYLNIYGLTKNVSYVDDFELYELKLSSNYTNDLKAAIAEWNGKNIPVGTLSGEGTLDLPQNVSASNVGVKWFSTSDTIDPATGAYLSGKEEVNAVLTARLYINGHEDDIYVEYEYAYIVKSMFAPYVEWLNTVFDSFGTSVSSNLKLPTQHSIKGYATMAVEWECSDPDVISSNGTFTAPETTKYVDLSATLVYSDVSQTVTRRVKAMGGNLVPDGLIMYYDFESPISNRKIKDVSGSETEYDATPEGIVIENGYAHFNTNDSTLVLPSNYGTELTGSYTVSLWANLGSNIAQSSGMYRFFDFGGHKTNSQFLRYTPSSGQLIFMDRGQVTDGSHFALNTTLKDIAGNWTLVTLVYDFESGSDGAAKATVYINGESFAVSSGDHVSSLKNNIAEITKGSSAGLIGRTQWRDDANPSFQGYMDDVRIYNRALNAEEIATLYEETKPILTAPVTIKYVDTDGNPIQDDVTVYPEVNTTYDVPESLKSVPGWTSEDGMRYTYVYLPARSNDTVNVSLTNENICTLVFKLEEKFVDTAGNLIANPSFEENVDGWTYNNGGAFGPVQGWVRSDAQAHEGKYSLKKNSDAKSASVDNLGTYIPITSGRVYKLSYWEYSATNVAAGTHLMNAVCVTSSNTAATDAAANHLKQFGGWSSWNQEGQASRDPAYKQGWNERSYIFDTRGATNANYIFIAYAWGGSMEFYIDDFMLQDITDGEESNTPLPGTGDDATIILKYFDTEGNKIAEDVEVTVASTVKTYEVPAGYRRLAPTSDYKNLYTYKFIESMSDVVINVSHIIDNVCNLYFEKEIKDRYTNLIENGSFETGVDGWTYNNGGTKGTVKGWVQSAEQAHDGKYSLKKASDVGSASDQNLVTYFPITPGKVYTLSYWEYSDNDIAAADANSLMSAACVTSDNNVLSTATAGTHLIKECGGHSSWYNDANKISPRDVAYSRGWNQRVYTFDTRNVPNANYIMIAYAWGWKTPNNFYIDDFSLTESVELQTEIYYRGGKTAVLVGPEGETGYFVQAVYNDEGALSNVYISDEITLAGVEGVEMEVVSGAKMMLLKDLTSLEPLCSSVIATGDGKLPKPETPSSIFTEVTKLQANVNYAIGISGTSAYLIPNESGNGFAVTTDEATAADKWHLEGSGSTFSLVSNTNSLALDVGSASKDAGATIGLWTLKDAGDRSNQQFTAEASVGGFMLKMVHSGYYVTSSATGTLTQDSASSAKNQIFTFYVK